MLSDPNCLPDGRSRLLFGETLRSITMPPEHGFPGGIFGELCFLIYRGILVCGSYGVIADFDANSCSDMANMSVSMCGI